MKSVEQLNHRTIELKLIRASTLDQLRTKEGKARMNMPYWIELEEAMVFQFVGTHTDPEALKAQISHGFVWVEEKYGR